MTTAQERREQFIQQMMPHAIRASQRTGVDPRIIIAQAAQETGWGQHAPNNNYFGIKSHGQGGGSNQSTREFVNGEWVTVNDSFRGYGSMGESVDGYADFLLENPRYRQMMQAQGLDAQLAALGASGYATDPNYASSVGSIARSITVPAGGAVTSQVAGDSRIAQAQNILAQQPPTAAPTSNVLAQPRTVTPADPSMLVGLPVSDAVMRTLPASATGGLNGVNFLRYALQRANAPATIGTATPVLGAPRPAQPAGVGGVFGGIANFLNERNR